MRPALLRALSAACLSFSVCAQEGARPSFEGRTLLEGEALFDRETLIDRETLFDGESLAGWETRAADAKWWGVAEGAIRGGSLDEDIPHNTFLATERSFQNFELRLSIRLRGSGGLVNSGIQLRSTRVAGSSEMRGYQVDAGEGWWGKLYDESRRNRVIAEPVDPERLAAAVRADGWNDYRIRAEGPRIRSWINGVPALDYVELEGQIPLDGHIGLQVHSGGRVLVEVRDISIEELPPTPNSMSQGRLEEQRAQATPGVATRTAAEERAGFTVLEGFEVELVTADPIVDKVVDVAFDDHGRMWAITAVEYPLDANESEGVAERYRRGGRDKLLVFDEPWREGPQTPRVFADGLFIPMALLPMSDGVLLGMGPDILRLHDDDGDGRADRRELVLTGFGIQDSHLLPHRFVRAPGDWIYVAQGAFNSSRVRTGDGAVVPFDQCKLGRFRPDGSRFEVVGIGLNNIWGFVIDRDGDKWIQEANDLGYPLVPFEHGRSYPGIGMDRFHPHSPWHPAYADFRMGGTGLSGLALSQDVGGFPAPWDETFFVANPILSAVQSIRARREPAEPSEVELERARDLLTSADKNFRPVAIHFGPDGCLYVVDWYNPIISHNEVPRDHPDRDRTSSRIWRVRHRSQEGRAPVDVGALPTAELVDALRSGSTWAARAAWHQIADRAAVELEGALHELALDASAPVRDRVLALWAAEDVERVSPDLVRALLGDPHHAIRREAARLAGVTAADATELVELLAELFVRAPHEADPRVRLAAIESLGAVDEASAALAALLLRFVRPLPDGPKVQSAQLGAEVFTGVAGDIAFERSLVRAALEERAEGVFALLDSSDAAALDHEARRFALLCAGGVEGARRLASALVEAGGVPSAEELPLLARHADEDEVRGAVLSWISRPESRARGLRMLLDSQSRWEEGQLRADVVLSLRALVAEQPSPEQRALLLRFARERRMSELEADVVALLDAQAADPLTCLRALVELGSQDALLFHELATTGLPGDELRRLAAGALAGVQSDEAFELLLELWPVLEPRARAAAVAALLVRRDGAARLVTAIDDEEIDLTVLDRQVLARLGDHLGDDPRLAELRRRAAREELPVLRLGGGAEDFADTDLALDGPFTIEAWVRLDEGISNADGLLCAPGVFDFNFHDARPRLWLGPGVGDVIIAERSVTAGTWVHLALTRAAGGRLSLYVDGELDVTTRPASVPRFSGLDVGRTSPNAGCAAWISELRIWSVERSAAEIGAHFRRRITTEVELAGLELILPRDAVQLSGNARVEGVLDTPAILSEEELRAEAERFERYRGLARASGDAGRGRELFVTNCATCHRVGGEGTSLGPVLDGVAGKGTEGLLRSILTPNAGVEPGYRTLIVRTTAGDLLDGFLAEEDSDSILLRRKEREDLRLPRSEIESTRYDQLSLMPEGLLEALSEQEVTDLLTYLATLE